MLLAGCSDDAPLPKADKTVQSPQAKAPPPLPQVAPQAFTVGSPSTVFSDVELKHPFSELPPGTEVAIHGQGPRHYEIRVMSGGKLHTAYMARTEVLLGTREEALAQTQFMTCALSVIEPENSTLLAGMLQDGKLLPGYDAPRVENEDFVGLGLDLVEAPPEEGRTTLDTPHLMEVVAPQAQDAYVKVKDQQDGLVAAFYVRAGKTAEVELPSGKFTTYFSTGRKFSKDCGIFLEELNVSKDETVLDFTEEGPAREVSYSLVPKQVLPGQAGIFNPKPISQDEFLK